jgi:hypothetical protein
MTDSRSFSLVRFFPSGFLTGKIFPYFIGKKLTSASKSCPFHCAFSSVLKTTINCQYIGEEDSGRGRELCFSSGSELGWRCFFLVLLSGVAWSALC